MSFTNNTTGQTFQVTEHYASSMSSAEWIEEAPSAARGRQIPLDTFGTFDFCQGTAVKDGQTVNIADAGARADHDGRPRQPPDGQTLRPRRGRLELHCHSGLSRRKACAPALPPG